MGKKRKNEFTFRDITPDEIFLDSENIPDFDKEQFEGRIEQPVDPKVFFFLGGVFLILVLALLVRVGYLQIIRGESFAERSINNHLRSIPVLAKRGLIYDTNGELLAWNDPAFSLILEKNAWKKDGAKDDVTGFIDFMLKNGSILTEKTAADAERLDQDLVVGIFYSWPEVNEIYHKWENLPLRIDPVSLRSYGEFPGLAHVVGYIGYPSVEDLASMSPVSYEEMVGKDGVEKKYENVLRGLWGYKLVEADSKGDIKSENLQENPTPGQNIKLSVDFRIQSKLYEILNDISLERGFNGGAGVIVNVSSGEILALVSYPEYDPQILSRGGPAEIISQYMENSQKPFLNRAAAGLYAPGSIIKPFIALAALNEKIISPQKEIFSSGSISLPNPYNDNEENVFYDWKAHGWVDMKRALAVSSNVYFYSIGGGYGDVAGLGIKKLADYFHLFGLGQKTGLDLGKEAEGIVPDPEVKKQAGGDPVWRIGDTFNASIGQGNFQVTPVQMAVATAALANNGYLVRPHLVLSERTEDLMKKKITIEENYFKIVKEGMRLAVLEGTAQGLSGLGVKIAAKTGTAELGSGKFVNSWLIAFWPYDDPQYAISLVLEKGEASNLIGGVFVARQLIEWMIIQTPEYFSADSSDFSL